ncbi:MAG: response regulator [Spirochaetales bacterium]|uniref:Response regulator n=1 Tax=Candidatus Thalassospirochaeta sargassi TaxID=3119039 RepID=A0AAJ1MNM8_9SPIO|nr:response regulator [Spirochaetales bacterium]
MKTKAIIAEDESILRLFLSMTLSTFGVDIRSEAQSGAEAVDAVRKHNPDVAFLDINMEAKEDGIDACEAIKSEFPETKVYFISAYPERVFQERLSSLDYDGYLEKPVNKEFLKSFLIKNALIA